MRTGMMMTALAAAAIFAAHASAQAPLQGPVAPRGPVALMAGGKATEFASANPGCQAQHLRETSKCNLFRLNGGTVNPVGCGCWESEKTFFWGGCRHFFSPQQTCGGFGSGAFGSGCCGGLNCLRRDCPPVQYGSGINPFPNNCQGPFSYTFR